MPMTVVGLYFDGGRKYLQAVSWRGQTLVWDEAWFASFDPDSEVNCEYVAERIVEDAGIVLSDFVYLVMLRGRGQSQASLCQYLIPSLHDRHRATLRLQVEVCPNGEVDWDAGNAMAGLHCYTHPSRPRYRCRQAFALVSHYLHNHTLGISWQGREMTHDAHDGRVS